MGIQLGGLDVGMPHQILDDPDVDTVFKQVGGEGMANMPSSAYSA